MAETKVKYYTAQAITLSLASLAHGASRESTAIDNSTNLYDDFMLNLRVKMGAAAPTGDIYVLLSNTVDGTNYSDPATGVDAAITVPMLGNLGKLQQGDQVPGTDLIFLARIPCYGKAAGATVTWNLESLINEIQVSAPPVKFGIVVVNLTGQALDATEGNHTKQYLGVTSTTA